MGWGGVGAGQWQRPARAPVLKENGEGPCQGRETKAGHGQWPETGLVRLSGGEGLSREQAARNGGGEVQKEAEG